MERYKKPLTTGEVAAFQLLFGNILIENYNYLEAIDIRLNQGTKH